MHIDGKMKKRRNRGMKKVINAKMYNTETAQEIGFYSNGMNYGDFCFVEETLYRKKNGEFFIEGHGGAKSRYARSCGNQCWGSGEDIVPLSIEEAKEWVEEHCSADVYIETFGDVPE